MSENKQHKQATVSQNKTLNRHFLRERLHNFLIMCSTKAVVTMPGRSPAPALTNIVYHKTVKKYTLICKAFFTEIVEK